MMSTSPLLGECKVDDQTEPVCYSVRSADRAHLNRRQVDRSMTSVYVRLQHPREALSYEGRLWIEADRLRFEPTPPVITNTEGTGEPVGVAFSSVTDLEVADEFVDIARPGRLRTGRWHA